MTEKETRISISNLTLEVEERRNVLSSPVLDHQHHKILDKWMSMFNANYVKEKIIEAQLRGAYYCVLATEKPGEGISGRIFNEQIEPHDQSVKNRLESLIDTKEIRVICAYSNKKGKTQVEIILYWGYFTMMIPSFFLEYPELTILFLSLLFGAMLTAALILYVPSKKQL